MACAWKSPTQALNAILICAQNSLSVAPGLGVPCQIIVGGSGADRAFSCCECGLLSITFDDIDRTQDSLERTRVTGSGACVEEFEFDVHVKVLRCIATFKQDIGGGATSGASVSPEQRTADSLANVNEAWKLLQDLNCCATDRDSTWSRCSITVLHQTILPPRGACFGHDTTLHVVLKACCPPIPRPA